MKQSDNSLTEQPLVEFRKISKDYGEVKVLNELDLAISRGSKTTLIGPSGSGKTTVLRILMTLVQPDKGRVLIDGEDLWHVDTKRGLVPISHRQQRPLRRRIGMVFQQYALFPNMTVLNNLLEGPVHTLKMDREAAVGIALDLLELVGLKGLSDRKPAELSGGQQQRVAIARTLAMKPDIVLLDEITSALDPELISEVLAVIRDIAAESSMTFLMVTHEMRFARDVSDMVVMFDQGQIVETGSPEMIFESPREHRTAKFLSAVTQH
jgi:polar amino acid transport system ATP-binding protein